MWAHNYVIMSYVQVAVLCDEGASSMTPSTFLRNRERKRKIFKDEKKHNGAVDESLSELHAVS